MAITPPSLSFPLSQSDPGTAPRCGARGGALPRDLRAGVGRKREGKGLERERERERKIREGLADPGHATR